MFLKALLLGAFATFAAAQSSVLSFTHVPNPVTDGHPQAITYSTNDTQTPVSIILRKGISTNLQTVMTLTTTSTGGQFIWTPPKSLPNGDDYALEITQKNQVNYFGPFIIQGASPSAVAQASKSSASAQSANSTMTGGTGTISMGTSTVMHRNTTMSSPTLTKTKTETTGKHTGTTVSSVTFVGTHTKPATQTSSGAATPAEVVSSQPFSLALGAIAALFYLF